MELTHLHELRLIKQSVDTLASKIDTDVMKAEETIATTTTQYTALLTQLMTLTTTVTKSSKVSTLQWAIKNVIVVGQFTYLRQKESHRTSYSSEGMVPEILMSFMRGTGHIIEGYILTMSQIEQFKTSAGTATARTAFHTALVNQIHTLTGVQPRIAPEVSNPTQFSIYYE